MKEREMVCFKESRWKCFIITVASLKSMTGLRCTYVKADNIKDGENTADLVHTCIQVEDVLENLYNPKRTFEEQKWYRVTELSFTVPLSFHHLFSIQTHCCMSSLMPQCSSFNFSLSVTHHYISYFCMH